MGSIEVRSRLVAPMGVCGSPPETEALSLGYTHGFLHTSLANLYDLMDFQNAFVYGLFVAPITFTGLYESSGCHRSGLGPEQLPKSLQGNIGNCCRNTFNRLDNQ